MKQYFSRRSSKFFYYQSFIKIKRQWYTIRNAASFLICCIDSAIIILKKGITLKRIEKLTIIREHFPKASVSINWISSCGLSCFVSILRTEKKNQRMHKNCFLWSYFFLLNWSFVFLLFKTIIVKNVLLLLIYLDIDDSKKNVILDTLEDSVGQGIFILCTEKSVKLNVIVTSGCVMWLPDANLLIEVWHIFYQ